MRRSLKKTTILASFFVFLGLALTWAEVKLRIYMKDGTLQSGNLVQEREKDFVIVSEEGSLKVPKKDIMFVNGKTLDQWKDKPDKLFQTEIIPDEIPKASYVNDKAALPKAPTIQPVTPLKALPPPPKKEPAKRKEPVKTATSPKQNQQPIPGPVQLKPEPKKAKEKPVVVKKKKKPTKKVVAQKKPKAKKKKVVAAPSIFKKKKVEPKKQKKWVLKKIRKPKGFSRKKLADYHYRRALAYMKKNEVGRATQEFHFATVLDRRNSDAAYRLGKIYMGHKVYERAKKTFKHPGLKRNKEIKKFVEQMDLSKAETEKQRIVLLSTASAGLLLCVPAVFLVRRFQKAKPRKTVIDSEKLKSPEVDVPDSPKNQVQEIIAELAAKQKARALVGAEEEKKSPPVSPSVPTEPREPAFQKPPEQKPPEKKPAEPIPIQEVIQPEPVADQNLESVEAFGSEPSFSMIQKSSVFSKPPKKQLGDHQLRLKVAKTVSESVARGHEFAAEGKVEEARRQYRTALVLDPISVEALLGMGYLSFIKSQWELSLEYYVAALEIQPNNADAHYGIGRVFMETNQVEYAIPELEKTLEIDPTFEDAQNTLTELGKAA